MGPQPFPGLSAGSKEMRINVTDTDARQFELLDKR